MRLVIVLIIVAVAAFCIAAFALWCLRESETVHPLNQARFERFWITVSFWSIIVALLSGGAAFVVWP